MFALPEGQRHPLDSSDRRLATWYALLTVLIFLPLTWAFATVNNLYPVPVWSLFSKTHDLAEGKVYYILRGETVEGEVVDLPAIHITNSLTGRNHMMVSYVVGNRSFMIDSPHPKNVAVLTRRSGVKNLRQGERVDALLASWGESYNQALAPGSPQRLREIRLVKYRWPGGTYENFTEYLSSWKVSL